MQTSPQTFAVIFLLKVCKSYLKNSYLRVKIAGNQKKTDEKGCMNECKKF